jgi:hypothetical protein
MTVFLMLAMSGCSDEQAEQNASAGAGEPRHVWKGQFEALDQAKRLEDGMNAAFRNRAEDTDQQLR